MVTRLKSLAVAMIAVIAFNHITSGQGYDYFDTSFHSPILDETKSMRIYLPPGYYFDTISYPIVYYMHGATGSYLK